MVGAGPSFPGRARVRKRGRVVLYLVSGPPYSARQTPQNFSDLIF